MFPALEVPVWTSFVSSPCRRHCPALTSVLSKFCTYPLVFLHRSFVLMWLGIKCRCESKCLWITKPESGHPVVRCIGIPGDLKLKLVSFVVNISVSVSIEQLHVELCKWLGRKTCVLCLNTASGRRYFSFLFYFFKSYLLLFHLSKFTVTVLFV